MLRICKAVDENAAGDPSFSPSAFDPPPNAQVNHRPCGRAGNSFKLVVQGMYIQSICVSCHVYIYIDSFFAQGPLSLRGAREPVRECSPPCRMTRAFAA